MAKKYVPSGYQIIDLGSHDLSSTVTINKGENADADVLIDLYTRGKLADKPVLLKIHNSDDANVYMGFVTISNGDAKLFLNSSSYIGIVIDSSTIEIDLLS